MTTTSTSILSFIVHISITFREMWWLSFWYQEEDYKKYLIDNKLVPPSYICSTSVQHKTNSWSREEGFA